MKTARCIGLMSGSSMDGVDLCVADFKQTSSGWNFQMVETASFSYSEEWRALLKRAHLLDALGLVELEVKLADFFIECMGSLKTAPETIDVAGIHGHTVFHFPERGISWQAGDGARIAVKSGIDCVTQFRTSDIAAGGQGAPLVPFGERHLFKNYTYFLNLGGIANLSAPHSSISWAMDVTPCNRVLDYLAEKAGKPFDEGGTIAASGKVIQELKAEIMALPYYGLPAPKSLGNEWAREILIPLLENSAAALPDLMATMVAVISDLISMALKNSDVSTHENILISGGGSANTFLLQQIKSKCPLKVYVADSTLSQYKEALIFAFLAMLRKDCHSNVLPSATGASQAVSAGALYLKKP
jgi:anhydro-N-acetylmuramic acid kinase